MSRVIQSASAIWSLAVPYFRSDDRWAARALLAAVIAAELAAVGTTVWVNLWYNRFYNALGARDWSAFARELFVFAALGAAMVILNTYQIYLHQWLQIRWRTWMTKLYLEHWLAGATHYRMQLTGDVADNPDQRIAEDINLFIDRTLTIGTGLLNSITTLASFIAILWTLSPKAHVAAFGTSLDIPGYLVWVALVYAMCGTAVTHLVGRPLVGLNFTQQHYEADFRFSLIRVRENSEQIALLTGERSEIDRLLGLFGRLVQNWHQIMLRQKRLTLMSTGYTQLSVIFPFVIVGPAYFAGAMELGGLIQTATAFAAVGTALSFFIISYRALAEWRAVVARLEGFERSATAARRAAAEEPGVNVSAHPPGAGLTINGLSIRLPDGTPLVATNDVVIETGEPTLLIGPSGAGKSAFFRTVAGLWPFGEGMLSIPRGAVLLMLPQRPYFPVDTLENAISYPAHGSAFGRTQVEAVLDAVGLPELKARLSEPAHWNRILSLGEQERLAIARAILHAPDYLFLDEATASLDEPSEAQLYHLLEERLPQTTIISIGHRSTLMAFHKRLLALRPEGDQHRLHDAGQIRPALLPSPNR